MSFADLTEHAEAVQLLQRSLERGRLGHGYLFAGNRLESLETVARTLAKALNCEAVNRDKKRARADACDHCSICRKIDEGLHPDVTWLRPESKSRIIRVSQVRDLIRTVNLKPTQASWKVGVIVAADRLKEEAANAFLKTLEEPPAQSILILLSTDPARLLETILSRCLRLNFPSEAGWKGDETLLAWLKEFAETAARDRGSLLSRYRLLAVLLKRLADVREEITAQLTKESPLERVDDVEPELKGRWEEELEAAIEAEYRQRRGEMLTGLQGWLRDIWVQSLIECQATLILPALEGFSRAVAKRVPAAEAMENLQIIERTQWLLGTNIQEALALEVGLLKLKL